MNTLAKPIGYQTSKWQSFLYETRARGSRLGRAEGAVASVCKSEADAREFCAQVFARLYDDPAVIAQGDREIPSWITDAHALLDEIPEFEALRAQCSSDPDMAGVAAGELIETIANRLPAISDSAKEEPKKNARGAILPGNRDAIRKLVRDAIARGELKVVEGRELLEGLAPGLGSAPAAHDQEDPARQKIVETVGRDPRFLDVIRRAGRISRLAADRRKVRDEHAKTEVVDIERGNDLSRALASSLAPLRSQKLRKLALRAIVERSLPQYRLEGKETLGRGPIVVMVDISGSMAGDPIAWATALAVALIGQGFKQKRPVTVIFFNGFVSDVVRVDRGVAQVLATDDPARVLAELGGVADATARCIRTRADGGTNFAPPLRYALAAGALQDRADFVFVTDGLALAPVEVLGQLVEAKSRGLRVFGMTVAGGSMSSSVAEICDEVVDLDRAPDVGRAIANAMPY